MVTCITLHFSNLTSAPPSSNIFFPTTWIECILNRSIVCSLSYVSPTKSFLLRNKDSSRGRLYRIYIYMVFSCVCGGLRPASCRRFAGWRLSLCVVLHACLGGCMVLPCYMLYDKVCRHILREVYVGDNLVCLARYAYTYFACLWDRSWVVGGGTGWCFPKGWDSESEGIYPGEGRMGDVRLPAWWWVCCDFEYAGIESCQSFISKDYLPISSTTSERIKRITLVERITLIGRIILVERITWLEV